MLRTGRRRRASKVRILLAKVGLGTGILTTVAVAGGAVGGASAQVVTARWHQVSAGSSFSCAIQDVRTLWCWGANGYGQLGNGSTTRSSVPARVGTRANWEQVSAGTAHACAVYSTFTLWCWGSNSRGELGINNISVTQADTPQRIKGDNWSRVSAGGDHTCAIRTDGTLWCWGANNAGQLGTGNQVNYARPVQVGTRADWAQVSAGASSTCAIALDRTLWCWGFNLFGQLGIGTFVNHNLPVQVGTGTWSLVSVGGLHTCAITTDSTLWCWGGDYNGQLGNFGANRQPSPKRVGLSSTWVQVAAGGHHTCALHGDPTLWCWGDNGSGQLGIGSAGGIVPRPAPVGTQPYWRQVSAGEDHSCAVRGDFSLWCWGANNDGQLGIGSNLAEEDSPVQVG